MHSKQEVQKILEKHGFHLDNESNVSDSYKFSLDNEWEISAFCSFVGNIFQNNVDKQLYEYIHVSLFDCIGTEYDFKSSVSLEKNIDGVIAELEKHSNNDDILKCEKCNSRYVQPKKPHSDKTWKPFLSCSGMMIVGRRQSNEVICNGTSTKIPAVVEL
jgi:hypothetical protein